MKYLFITDDPQIAAYVQSCSVERIFVDLEILGKVERQGGLDTVISRHRIENLPKLRNVLNHSRLLVRVNPLHAGTLREIEQCIDAGVDLLMLPMFRSAKEVSQFCRFVNGRAGVVPLVETADAMQHLSEVVRVDGVCEVHIGLNDLHLDLGLNFMFEPLANGLVDRMADCCRNAGVPFGVGGISAVGQGLIPGEIVLAEHARIGSTAAILSRTFHQRASSLVDLQAKVDLPVELKKLRDSYRQLLTRTPEQVESDRREFARRVAAVVGARSSTA